MVRLLLIVQMPDAGDERMVSLFPRPIDRLMLRFERRQCVVRVVLDYIVINMAAFGPALWSWFNIDIGHNQPP